MTHEQRAHALTLIASAHLRALHRHNVKPPQKLFKLYPHLKPKPKRRTGRRITRNEAREIFVMAWSGVPQAEIVKRFGISQTRVSDIKRGRTWKDATKGMAKGGTP